jgi:hypothetical protein
VCNILARQQQLCSEGKSTVLAFSILFLFASPGAEFSRLDVVHPSAGVPECTWDGIHYSDMPARVYAMMLWTNILSSAVDAAGGVVVDNDDML